MSIRRGRLIFGTINSMNAGFHAAATARAKRICEEHNVSFDVFRSRKNQGYLLGFRTMVVKRLTEIHVDGIRIPSSIVLEVAGRSSYSGLTKLLERPSDDYMVGLERWRFVQAKGYRDRSGERTTAGKTANAQARRLGRKYHKNYLLYRKKEMSQEEALRMAEDDKRKDERVAQNDNRRNEAQANGVRADDARGLAGRVFGGG